MADNRNFKLGGPLRLKTGLLKRKKTPEKPKVTNRKRSRSGSSASSSSSVYSTSSSESDLEVKKEVKQEEEQVELVRQRGTGRIISSGTTVSGFETKFQSELSHGDVIIISHPTTLADEIRVVKIVVSDVSISISSPFSSDLSTTTAFQYVKEPDHLKNSSNAKSGKMSKRKEKNEEEEKAFGTFATKKKFDKKKGKEATILTYRVRKGGSNTYGGYKIVRKEAEKEMSREELLDLRCKQTGDRNCM